MKRADVVAPVRPAAAVVVRHEVLRSAAAPVEAPDEVTDEGPDEVS